MSKIKTIIFDFDDTLYTNADWHGYKDYVYDLFTKFFGSKEKTDKLFADFENVRKKNYFSFHELFCYFADTYPDAIRMYDLVDENLYVHKTMPKLISHEFLERLTKSYSVYIVSSSTQAYLKKYIKDYCFNDIDFKGILSVDWLGEDRSKAKRFTEIMEVEKIKPSELLVVGDNPYDEIASAKRVKAKYLFFTERQNFNQIYSYFTRHHILNSTAYME